MTTPIPTVPARRGLRSRLSGARRRAAVVTSAALLATGLSVSGCSVSADAEAPTSAVEAEAPPATLLPPIALVSETASAEAPAETTPAEGERIGSGRASYYGAELAGNPTASGEAFNPREMTAAHRTLPFGTRVRVTNEHNGESVVVRINDRGPFHGDRVLDVSTAAAEEIGLKRAGTAPVTMERLPKRPVRG